MRLYGITEIARELGIPSNTVKQWHRRGKLPKPSAVLAMGPVWSARVVEPWLAQRAGPQPCGVCFGRHGGCTVCGDTGTRPRADGLGAQGQSEVR